LRKTVMFGYSDCMFRQTFEKKGTNRFALHRSPLCRKTIISPSS
jgi:hypothetical protein